MARSRPSPLATRRQFIVVGMAAIGAAWAGVAAQSLLFPERGAAQAQPVYFPVAELPPGGVKPVAYGGAGAIVLRTEESLRCFSLTCTHLGCTVQWQGDKGQFFCPCHEGRFDQFGEPVAGPPVIPLEQIPVRIEGETVIVGEQV